MLTGAEALVRCGRTTLLHPLFLHLFAPGAGAHDRCSLAIKMHLPIRISRSTAYAGRELLYVLTLLAVVFSFRGDCVFRQRHPSISIEPGDVLFLGFSLSRFFNGALA